MYYFAVADKSPNTCTVASKKLLIVNKWEQLDVTNNSTKRNRIYQQMNEVDRDIKDLYHNSSQGFSNENKQGNSSLTNS